MYITAVKDMQDAFDEDHDEVCKELDLVKARLVKAVGKVNKKFNKVNQQISLEFNKLSVINGKLVDKVKKDLVT